MIERIYTLKSVAIEQFVGCNRANLIALNNLFPKVKLRLLGQDIQILASSQEGEQMLTLLQDLEQVCLLHGELREHHIVELARGRGNESSRSTQKEQMQTPPPSSNLIIYGLHGRAIVTRGENQTKMLRSFEHCDLCFATGPAGSGKTFVAICLAVRAFKMKQVRRIILSRPAVEAGEKLGFLPGEMKDKLDPYLQPLYDALGELIPQAKLRDYMEQGMIQIAPLAFMRGRTLNDAVIILDEAQNTTPQQMKMFLTRLGTNSKMIVTGDLTQVDLPREQRSGLRDALEHLQGLDGISFVQLERTDIVRHPLVERIVESYDKTDSEQDNKPYNPHK